MLGDILLSKEVISIIVGLIIGTFIIIKKWGRKNSLNLFLGCISGLFLALLLSFLLANLNFLLYSNYRQQGLEGWYRIMSGEGWLFIALIFISFVGIIVGGITAVIVSKILKKTEKG